MKRTITIFLAFLCVFSVFCQDEVYLLGGLQYKFFPTDTAPDPLWKETNFVDTSWQDGLFSIGFGYDDTTVIEKTTTLYLRSTFELGNIDTIHFLQLMANFDDGFIAYLNGNEIVRVNMGKIGESKAFNSLADRSREARNTDLFYTTEYCNPNYAYYIDSSKVHSFLKTGKNVLAVEVHNDSLNGSDLSFQSYLVDVTQNSYNAYSPFWRGIQQIDLESTHLPIVKIETDEFGINQCGTRIDATMKIIKNADGVLNKPDDTVYNFNGKISIETRGQSSGLWPKYNFNLETKDSLGQTGDVKILGMGKENDWILFGPYVDRSQIRNEIMYTLSNSIGLWAPQTRYCELILNGEYYGLYQIIEKIKRNKNRVDIKKLNDYDNSGVDLTGGYIIKRDKDKSGMIIVYPKSDNITMYQNDYINAFYTQALISSRDSLLFHPEYGYKNFIDIPSFMDYTILEEFCKNPDAYKFSFYMNKDRDDINNKLQFGPVWDQDLAFGNSTFQDGESPFGWQFDNKTNSLMYQTRFFKDSTLVDQLEARWKYLRQRQFHTDSVMKLIDDKIAYLGDAITRNYTVWPLEDRPMNMWGFNFASSYDEEISHLKSWITQRLSWMDTEIPKIYYPYTYKKPTSLDEWENQSQFTVYPNPFRNSVVISYYLSEPSQISISISDVTGKILYSFSEKLFDTGALYQVIPTEDFAKGTYILKGVIGDKSVFVETLIKN